MATNIQPPVPLSDHFPGKQRMPQFDQSLQLIYEALSDLVNPAIGFTLDWSMADVLTRVYLDDLLSEILGDGDDTISYELDVLLGVV